MSDGFQMTEPIVNWRAVRVGDVVIRLISEEVGMRLRVTEIDDELIHCGDWTFEKAFGAEVDHELGWGPEYGVTGSRLTGFFTPPKEDE